MRKMVFGGLALLALAACGESATAPAGLVPRWEGGGTYGGGLAVPPPPAADATENVECATVERGGGTYGGGLYTSGPCLEP